MRNHAATTRTLAFLLAFAGAATVLAQSPLGSEWTYQGRLVLAGIPLNDVADFGFSLWDDAAAGAQIGSTHVVDAVTVVDGLFAADLDFGVEAFNGEARWLQIAVRSPAGGGNYTTLSPRQPITATPYAMQTRGIFVDESGNVGVGTTMPGHEFDVMGTARATVFVGDGSGLTGISGDNLGDHTATTNVALAGNWLSGDGEEEGVFISNAGRVGIGTEAPNSELHVKDGDIRISNDSFAAKLILVDDEDGSDWTIRHQRGTNRLQFVESGTVLGEVSSAGEFTAQSFVGDGSQLTNVPGDNLGDHAATTNVALAGNWLSGDGESEGIYVADNGNVGIGTTSPVEVLDVAGSVKASGVLQSGASIVIDGTVGSERIVSSEALEIHTSAGRAARLEPAGPNGANLIAPNVVLGDPLNSVSDGVVGATIAGGGGDHTNPNIGPFPNQVEGDWGTVGGGYDNTAGEASTVSGGEFNTASGETATIGGGSENIASGSDSIVGGGEFNVASANWSTVAGGEFNEATGSDATVGGGSDNTASGSRSTVPGGSANVAGGNYSFAAGHRARVRNAAQSGDGNGDEGTFVWADSTNANFMSTGPDQFLIRAAGGMGIGTNSPSEQLHVAGNICATGAIGSCSDARFKMNVASVGDALNSVSRLRAVRFDWKRNEFPDRQFANERQIGFIAQEVEKVIPEAVSTGSDGYYTVDYGRVTPMLVEAIKELRAQQDAELEVLRHKNAELEQRLLSLEAMLAQSQKHDQ